MSVSTDFDVVVIGAGPAGTAAALRAGDLGARTALITRAAFGGMSANEGPIPVRTLAHAARLAREARQLPLYGVQAPPPTVDYEALVARAKDVVGEARRHSNLLDQVRDAKVALHEHAGTVRFEDAHRVRSERGPTLRSSAFIICSGGISRPLTIPGAELAVTPADAFSLTSVPKSLVVIGAGATGAQVASIFNAFGSSIVLLERGHQIVPTEDADVSRSVAQAFRDDGIRIYQLFGTVERVEKTSDGVRVVLEKDGDRDTVEGTLAVCAIGWIADTEGLDLAAAGVRTNSRGFIEVDARLQTSAPNIYAAGDVIGRVMLVPQAVQDGVVAGTNAVGSGKLLTVPDTVNPIGSFTDPEYARVGMTEADARESHDVLAAVASYAETTRPVIDGRTRGFCKIVVDRNGGALLGCHIVGERAVEVAQMAAIAMTAKMSVGELARVPFSFPTYANVLGRAALRAVRDLGKDDFSAP